MTSSPTPSGVSSIISISFSAIPLLLGFRRGLRCGFSTCRSERSALRPARLPLRGQLLGLFPVLVDTDGDVTHDHVVDAHTSLELHDLLACAVDLEQNVVAV